MPAPIRALATALVASTALGATSCVAGAAVHFAAEQDFPDRGPHVAAAGVDLRYVERGTGVPVVLLHGAYGGLEDWEATILGDVAARGRANEVDRPGPGWSDGPCEPPTPRVQASVLRDACRALGAERPVLVGFSWGGAVAAAWAAEWPDEVAGLVLLNAPTHPWGGSPDVVDVLAGVPVLGEILTWNVFTPAGAALAPVFARNAFDPEPVPEAFAASPLPLALRPRAFRSNAEDVRILDAALAAQAAGYAAIRCPVVFVVGDGDRIVGPEWHSPRFAADVPQTRRVVVAGAGHQIPYTRPDECLRAIDAVLADLRRAP